MKKQTALIIFLIVILLAGLFVIYLLFFTKNEDASFLGETRNRIFGSFFPTDDSVDETGNNIRTEGTLPETNRTIPRLRKIYSEPTAGAIIFDREVVVSDFIIKEDGTQEEKSTTTNETAIRFIDRATGNLFETTSTNLTINRLTNTTIPQVYEALFSADANSVILTSLNSGSLESFVATYVPKEEATSTLVGLNSEESLVENFGSLEGFYLPFNAFGLSLSPDRNAYVFLLTTDDVSFGEKTTLYTGTFTEKDGVKHQLFTYNSNWIINWVGENTIAYNTKASQASFGYLYFLNLNSGSFEKKIGDYIGLNSLVNNNLSKALFSQSGNGFNMRVYDFENNSFSFVDYASLPNEKCVWSKIDLGIAYCAIPENIPNASYPDAWYLGLVSFNDSVVKIDTENNNQAEVLMLYNSESNEDLDMFNLSLSPKEDYLLFQNKNDLSLWSLDLIN